MQLNLNILNPSNTAERRPPYTILAFYDKNYRILTQQHVSFLLMANMWAVFWSFLSLFLSVTGFLLLFDLQVAFILLAFFVCHLIFTLWSFTKRNQFASPIYFSLINLLVCLVPMIVLTFLEIKQIVIPIFFYILIQTLISIKYLSNKSKILIKFLLLIEFIMIGLKIDDKIEYSWKDILFIQVIFFLFLSISIFFMTTYLIYMKCNQNSENLMKEKFPGALFIYLSTIGLCMLVALPLFKVIFEISLCIVCFSISFALACIGAFIHYYKQQIVIIFCTLNEIKSFNQIISFEPIENLQKSNEGIICKSNSIVISSMHLYKISQHWFTTSPEKVAEFQKENPQIEKKSTDPQKMAECAVCLDQFAEVVWMPCGHLIVCMHCFSFMFENKNLNCVLCKKMPEQLLIINIKQKSNLLKQQTNCDMPINNTDVSILSSSFLNQKNVIRSKSKLTKQQSKPKNNKNIDKKEIFTVIEGYNVKIL